MPCCSAGKCLNCTSGSTSAPVELEINDGFWQSSFQWVYSEYSSQWPNDWEKPSLLGFHLFNVIKPSGTGCLETWKRGHLLNRFHWQPLHLSSKNPLNSKVIHYLEIPWGMDEERHGGIWQSFQPSGHLASPNLSEKSAGLAGVSSGVGLDDGLLVCTLLLLI